ncbi:hypothetical protein MAPG_01888 [Magnaporthiopsis poae ATCC 64411]|uniref:Fungal N-terminal domain-containing protein n=1 Tax=Magnaporthiopsis poae (strain ATCC 64411 / 73-15) TaxID=644358 RepID=A0A0C4DPV9_MAGP6|nr:hypothetical protein MAPG_01888 [Magnaporthiopsis poae ATCC 64411]
MAEALGLAASILQVADVGLRTSLGLIAFFSALHQAQPEFSRHLIVLRDVYDALRLLRKAVLGPLTDTTLNQDETSVLSRQLTSISDELSSIEKITAGKDPSKPTGRLRWVLKKPEIERTLLQLESHKTSLLILLQAMEMRKSAQLLQAQNSFSAKLCDLESRIEQQERLYQQSLDDGFASLAMETQASGRDAGHTTRQALEVLFRPILESELAKFEARNETRKTAEMREFRAILGQASFQIDAHISRLEARNEHLSRDAVEASQPIPQRQPSPMQHHRSEAAEAALSHHSPHEGGLEGNVYPVRAPRCGVTITASEWSHWASIPLVGTFRIRYWLSASPRGRFYNFTICFWPSSNFVSRTGFSLKYSNRPDVQGCLPLFPSLAIYSVLPSDDPIWLLIHADNVEGVMARFSQKLNTPFDEDSEGETLLIHASRTQSYKTVEFLLGRGVDPKRLSAAPVSTFRLLVAAGCDVNLAPSSIPFTSMFLALCAGFVSHERNSSVGTNQKRLRSQYLNRVTRLANVLNQEGCNFISMLERHMLGPILHGPCNMPLLPLLRAFGLPSDRGSSSDKPPWFNTVIYTLLEACAKSIFREDFKTHRSIAGENLADFLAEGCDLYDIGWRFDDPAYNHPVTPTVAAEGLGITPSWRWALIAAGYDADEVIAEDARRRRWFRLRQGASSSEVDMEGGTLQGSLRRRARRAVRDVERWEWVHVHNSDPYETRKAQ